MGPKGGDLGPERGGFGLKGVIWGLRAVVLGLKGVVLGPKGVILGLSRVICGLKEAGGGDVRTYVTAHPCVLLDIGPLGPLPKNDSFHLLLWCPLHSMQGRTQLGSSAGFSRLLVVLLHHDHHYQSLDFVKAELSAKVLDLAPRDRSNKEVPFLR